MTTTPDDVPAPEPGLDGMDAHSLVELVAACHAQIAALQAVQAGAIGALLTTPDFSLPPDPDSGGEGAGEPLIADLVAELAARLTLTSSAAGTLVTTADRLTRCLPATLAALAAGRTDLPRAKIVADGTALLTDDQARYIDEEIATDVTSCTTGQLRDRLQRKVVALDPDVVRRRARRAVADRSVRYYPVGDGIAEMLLRGPATDLRCAYESLTSFAKDTTRPGATTDPHAGTVHGPGGPDSTAQNDQRGLDAKRFDVAISALTAPCPEAPGIGAGRGPQLFVHLSTALGLDEASGELVGHGPIPASHVRSLLERYGFRRLFTDPVTGDVTAVDGHSYPPGTIPDLTRPASAPGRDDTDTDESVDAGQTGPRDEPRNPGRAVRDEVSPREVSHDSRQSTTSPPCPELVPPRRSQDTTPGADRGAEPPGTGSPAASELPPVEPRRPHPPCPVAAAGGGSYAIPAGTKRLVKVRSRRCMAPGCRAPATRCDTDHVLEWPVGPTCPCNLLPLCRRHHELKTRRRWRLRRTTTHPRDATVTWSTTLGYRYTVSPEPLLPVPPDRDQGAPPPATPVNDRLAAHYDRGYPTGPPEPDPDPDPGSGSESDPTGGGPSAPPRPAEAPRRTWVDLPDDPPY